MGVPTDIWMIDIDVVFQNHSNFLQWHKLGDDGPYAGIAFGRPAKKEVTTVLFVAAESMNSATSEFLKSGMAADLEHVGTLSIDGMATPIFGEGLVMSCPLEVLAQGNAHGFVESNPNMNIIRTNSEGLTLRSTIGFECLLRKGTETEDLKTFVERFCNDLDRFVFINECKGVVLMRLPEKEKVPRVLDELSKGCVQLKDSLEFTGLQSLTRNTKDDKDDQKMVPIVRITKDGTAFLHMETVIDIALPVYCGEDSNQVYDRIQEAIRRRLHNFLYVAIDGFKKENLLSVTDSTVFMPPGWSTLLHLQMPRWSDDDSKSYRKKLHRLFNLSSSGPSLRKAQQLTFGTTYSKLLRSPHTNIISYKPVGRLSLVKGPYNYHHYMQDAFDDSGWGCAYRSLQTIWSWLVLNGYTDTLVPSHRDIQQCLVDIGDKEPSFVGSRKWIGSTEIGFVLDTMLSMEFRIIHASSGDQVVDHVRQLAHHFDNIGSPVMIGGGQLAHTILGVDFDENTGACAFLILDPHYTGSEDLRTVLSKGWCGWKQPSFWGKDFYNMILPIPPTAVI